MTPNHDQQTMNMLVGYSEDTLGFVKARFRSTSAPRP
jgi:hypothetical protein